MEALKVENNISDDVIIVGKINGFFGVKGWVKVFSHTEPKDNITKYKKLLVKESSAQTNTISWKPYEITQGRVQGKTVVMHIKGYDNKDDVQKFLGCELAVNAKDLPKLGKKEFYWRDLIGLKVNNTDGDYLGIVESMLATGNNDVAIIKPERAKPEEQQKNRDSILIPFVLDMYIKEVDLASGNITVYWEKDWD